MCKYLLKWLNSYFTINFKQVKMTNFCVFWFFFVCFSAPPEGVGSLSFSNSVDFDLNFFTVYPWTVFANQLGLFFFLAPICRARAKRIYLQSYHRSVYLKTCQHDSKLIIGFATKSLRALEIFSKFDDNVPAAPPPPTTILAFKIL